MRTALDHLFSFNGRITRLPFAVGVATSLIAFYGSIEASSAMLPTLAGWLAPRGINAGLVLNAVWCLLGITLVWALSALGMKRLRDIDRSPWWAPAAVLPLAALAMLNDAIFLVSRTITFPRPLMWLVLAGAGGTGLWVLAEGLTRRSRS